MRQGWVNKKLIEIADVSTGKYDANHAIETGKYRFYTCAYNYGMCNTNRFSGECLILPGNGVNVGEVFYYEGEFDAYQRTYVLNNIKIFPKYLHYHMLLYWKERGTKLQYGSATNFIKIGNFQNYDVSYPPLTEQKRIVAILDEAFAAIDKAKANAEQNLKNAKELFDIFLDKCFTAKEDGLEEKKLKEIAEYFNGLTYSPKDVSNKGIIVLRSSNIQNDKLDFSDIVRVSTSVKEKIIVKDGDILMCSRNGSKRLVGKTAPIGDLPEKMTFGTFMMIVRSDFNPYLLWFFKSLDFKKQINGGENTMINQITRYMLDDVIVPFPSIEKQLEIAQQLDAIYNQSQKLEFNYHKKLTELEGLKKSILQKAFTGELSPSTSIKSKTAKSIAI
jgi:type I restriction enzyme S subunit